MTKILNTQSKNWTHEQEIMGHNLTIFWFTFEHFGIVQLNDLNKFKFRKYNPSLLIRNSCCAVEFERLILTNATERFVMEFCIDSPRD